MVLTTIIIHVVEDAILISVCMLINKHFADSQNDSGVPSSFDNNLDPET